MLTLTSLPAFEDNYIWVWHDGHHAVAVDPGDPAPLIAFLDAHQLALTAVLITHHHRDHTGGITQLRQRYNCAIYAPDNPRIPAVTHVLRGGDSVDLAEPGLHFEVLATPGHTLPLPTPCPSISSMPWLLRYVRDFPVADFEILYR